MAVGGKSGKALRRKSRAGSYGAQFQRTARNKKRRIEEAMATTKSEGHKGRLMTALTRIPTKRTDNR